MPRLLTSLANAYLLAFVLDAVLSVADLGLALAGVEALSGVQALVALLVLAASGLMLLVVAASPALPWRVLATPAIFPIVVTVLTPIPSLLVFGFNSQPLTSAPATLLQLGVAAVLLREFRRTGGGWLRAIPDEPAFTWRRVVAALAGVGVGAPLALAVAFAAEVVVGIDVASSGFLRLTLRGVDDAAAKYPPGIATLLGSIPPE